MALTKVINNLADLNQSGSPNALKGCVGDTSEQPSSSSTIDYLLVAGGGGGGGYGQAGGGGAGGYITGSTTVYQGTPAILTIGEGGAGGYSGSSTAAADIAAGVSGSDSGFNGIRAIGGGSGSGPGGNTSPGRDGGSGGGGGTKGAPGLSLNNQGNNAGAEGAYTTPFWGAGGGGAGSVGGAGGGAGTGTGGTGVNINTFIDSTNATLSGIGEINSTNVWVGGGAGAGSWESVTGAAGGLGGGADSLPGAGGSVAKINGLNGTSNTGGGGSGASAYSDPSVGYSSGGTGGSGVVILQYNNTEVTSYTLTGSLVGGVNTTDNSAVVDFPAGAGCQALYQFENNTNDSSSNSYNPTSEANTAFPTSSPAPKFGTYSLELDGSTTYVNGIPIGLMTKIRTAAQFSVSVWVNPKTRPTGSGYANGKQIVKFLDDIYLSIYLDEELTLNYSVIPSLGVYIESPQTTSVRRINLNEWSHICLTGSAANGLKFYINGQQEAYNPSWPGTFIYYGNSSYQTNGLTGNYPSLPGNPTQVLDGNLDNLRVYDNELTQSQVLELTNMNLTTKFVDSPTAGTDTLVFKGGTGSISFENTETPGAEIGMVRTNTDLYSANSTSGMEHFTTGGWKDFTNCTTSICNYPTTARCLYTFDGDIVDACGNTSPDYLTGISYTAGKFGQGFAALGTSSALGYSRIGWSSGLGVNYNTSDFSISLWLKQYSYASYSACGNNALCYGYIFSGWSDSYWTLSTDQQAAGNTIAWKSWGPGAGQTQTAESGVFDLNTWYHIVCTRSTTDGIQLWLNNQLVASVSGSWTAGTASVYDMIGGYGDTGYTRQGLDGSISQFRLFESVLTPEQISQLYNEVYCP